MRVLFLSSNRSQQWSCRSDQAFSFHVLHLTSELRDRSDGECEQSISSTCFVDADQADREPFPVFATRWYAADSIARPPPVYISFKTRWIVCGSRLKADLKPNLLKTVRIAAFSGRTSAVNSCNPASFAMLTR